VIISNVVHVISTTTILLYCQVNLVAVPPTCLKLAELKCG
jgi:hypothetical protein